MLPSAVPNINSLLITLSLNTLYLNIYLLDDEELTEHCRDQLAGNDHEWVLINRLRWSRSMRMFTLDVQSKRQVRSQPEHGQYLKVRFFVIIT